MQKNSISAKRFAPELKFCLGQLAQNTLDLFLHLQFGNNDAYPHDGQNVTDRVAISKCLLIDKLRFGKLV